MRRNTKVCYIILATYSLLSLIGSVSCKADGETGDKSLVVTSRNRTEKSIKQLADYTVEFIADNDRFPDMSSPLKFKQALLKPYAKGDASDFVDTFGRPFRPNPSLSNRPENVFACHDQPAGTIMVYQAKPLSDGSRWVYIIGKTWSCQCVSAKEWRRLLKLRLNSSLQ